MQAFQTRIGHTFRDPSFLATALTHRSFGASNNERLEFLGDSILNFTIADALFRKYRRASEGDLSRLRALLVRGDTLADIAREYDFGPHLRMGEGELRNGGQQRTSILADSVEAVIGAIFLDAGIEAAQTCVLQWFRSRIDALSLSTFEKDPKTQLQEWLQAQHLPLPVYQIESVDGEAHQQCFTVSCSITIESEPTVAHSGNRRSAEKEAAEMMLARLEARGK